MEDCISSLIINDEDLKTVSSLLFQQLEKGLAKATHHDADLKMFPSYVTNIAVKNVNGKFLALDLGGTNFRVLLVTLNDGKYSVKSETYSVSNDIMIGPGVQLFDHIAGCLVEFSVKYDVIQEKLPLGFTFSFPCFQNGLDQSILLKWTKGFCCSGVEGEDVVGLLREAINRNGKMSIDVVAVLNDTVGTLMSCAYIDENCAIGIIAGTGSNACYIENIENVELINKDMLKSQNEKHVIINTEWGQFGLSGIIDFIKTKYDCDVDANSIRPGYQVFEKLVSGMYLGELVRLAVVDLAQKKLIFNGEISEKLLSKGSFLTAYISACETDEEGNYEKTREVLQNVNFAKPSDEDCKKLKYICRLISTRAAHLVACGLSAILKKMQKPKVIIACDGTLLKRHPYFRSRLERKLHDLSPEHDFELMLSEDGSGRGAAIVAAAETSQ